jgi:hypothetical protein
MKIAPVTCDLQQKENNKEILTFIHIHTYLRNLFIVFSPGKSKKTKTNPISITTVTPLLSKDQKNLSNEKKNNKQIKFYCSLQAKIIIIFFYFCTPSATPLSYLTTKNTKFFTNQKTGKNLFYVLFHHHLYYNSLCQPSTKLSSNSIHYN